SLPDTLPVVFEMEPNDSTIDAQTFTPGDAIRGSFSTLDDFDYYRFGATQGKTYIFWADIIPTRYTMRILGPDGATPLAFSRDRTTQPPNQGFMVWTSPRTAPYSLRMVIFGSPPVGSYRVLTSVDTPGGPFQRARDQRDAFVASST